MALSPSYSAPQQSMAQPQVSMAQPSVSMAQPSVSMAQPTAQPVAQPTAIPQAAAVSILAPPPPQPMRLMVLLYFQNFKLKSLIELKHYIKPMGIYHNHYLKIHTYYLKLRLLS